jgi:hypothetical protein
MGLLIEFPAKLVRRADRSALRVEMAEVVILPSVRIERHEETSNDGREPDEGNKTRKRRRRS